MTTQARFEDLVLWVRTHDVDGVTLGNGQVRWQWAWPSAAHEVVYHADGRLEGVPQVTRWDGSNVDHWDAVFGACELREPWRRQARFEQLREAVRRRRTPGGFVAPKVVGWYPQPADRSRYVAFGRNGDVRGTHDLTRWDTLPQEQWELVLKAVSR